MEQQIEPLASAAVTEPAIRSTAAERMRRHRQRRRKGLRSLIIELRETEVDTLVRRGLLQAEMRNDPRSVRKAVHTHFDRTLRSIP
jgi:hypothetical protein